MNMILRLVLLYSFVSLTHNCLYSQDSITPFYQWEVTSRKIDDDKYILKFSTSGFTGWQLYSPGQIINEVAMVSIGFVDPSIDHSGKFRVEGAERVINSRIFDNNPVKLLDGFVSWETEITLRNTIPANLQGVLNYAYGRTGEFYPVEFPFKVALEGGVYSNLKITIGTIDVKNPISDCGDEVAEDSSFVSIFTLGLIGGLIALLTPCVFPMIPVTVSYFTKNTQNRRQGKLNAVLYGLFIFLIYILITVPFHLADKAINPEVFNNISTNAGLNIFFFSVFLVFAFSFFGFYEIGLPSVLANNINAKSGITNIGGIFFLATTLTIVSFSCTGPLLGTLLVGVAAQGAWPLSIGAAGFGLALGLPFAVFAMFPGWMQKLPKSGNWMKDVKVVLGFAELALALKFLSNADLVKQWGLLKREIFIALWIVIALITTLYLSGIFKKKKASTPFRYPVTRLFFVLIFSVFTVYLIPGVTNTKLANLKLLSGFPPPLCYSVFDNPVNCKQGVRPIENDYELAAQKAKQEDKPLLIDFTGWACVNCRKMEESVWTNQEVAELMSNKFVVVSLYVDDKRNLPLKDQINITTASGENKSIFTVGDRWSSFQSENFGATSQPQYAILSPEQIALSKTKFYTSDAKEFARWLRCGLEAFDKAKISGTEYKSMHEIANH